MNEGMAKAWIADRVSRETMQRLELFYDLLLQWQKTINLVAPSTVETAWSRHFVDSAQLFDLSPEFSKHWLDLGSGGGFPGIVIAAMAVEKRPDLRMSLVESDIRKAGFLRESARRMGLPVNIIMQRISDVPPQPADVISARALGSLSKLIDFVEPHVSPTTCLLFPKGSSYAKELETLSDDWQIRADVIKSVTDPDAVVLRFLETDVRTEA